MSDVTELVREARRIDAEVKELSEQKSALVERIKTELSLGEKVVVDGVACTLRPGNRKFSVVKALELLPTEIKTSCVSSVIDEKKVRDAIEAMFGSADAAMEAADPSKTILDLAK